MVKVEESLKRDPKYQELMRRAKAAAALKGISLKQWVAEAIKEKIEREKGGV